MRYLSMLILLMLLALRANSTNISKGETQINIINGDTLLTMCIDDARGILSDVLQKEVLDSIVFEYKKTDSLNIGQITLLKSQIVELIAKGKDQEEQIKLLNLIVQNNQADNKIKADIISKQKKKIKKFNRQKIVGFTLAVILPAVTAGTIMGIQKH